MPFLPFHILGIWLRSLLALVLLGGAIYLLVEWYNHRWIEAREPAPAADQSERAAEQPPEENVRVVSWHFGLNRETAYLLGGLALAGWSLGGWTVRPLLRRSAAEEPQEIESGEVHKLRRPDGTELHVEIHGPPDGIPLVLTHGWGLDHNEWCYAQRELARTYRLILWDLPGLGQSSRPADNNWDLEKLAGHLEAVLALAGDRPAVLVGHSIGGMIVLTFCKLFPQALGQRVRGLVLAHSTYTNPVKTTSLAGLYIALQKPVLEPLCHLMAWLSPIVFILNWLSYLNGSAHRSTERNSFSGRESRGQLNFLTRYYLHAWPGVVARGMLAMFRYDATATLAGISVPTLVITGDQDRTCTPEASAYMAKTISAARLATLQPAKHGGLFEHHSEFDTLMGQFVSSCST